MAIKNRPTQLNGINPLAYVGVNPYTPPGMYQLPRDPTVRDNAGFQIGDYWINQSSNDLWYLAQKSNPPQYQDALWIQLGKGPSIRTLTGDTGGPVGPDVNGNIDTLGGAAGRNTNTAGFPGTNTMRFNLNNVITLGDLAPVLTTDFAIRIDSGSIHFNGTTGGNAQRIQWPELWSRMDADAGATPLWWVSGNTGNTLIGYDTAGQNAISNNNTALGYQALKSLGNSDVQNTAVGAEAGVLIGDAGGFGAASQNTIIGSLSMRVATTSSACSTLGRSTLTNLLTGDYNVAVGANAGDAYVGNESSNILVSNAGIAAESNTIRIGTQGNGAGQQDRNFQAGIHGVTPAGADIQSVVIDSSGQLGTSGAMPFSTAFGAYISANIPNVTGAGTIYQIIFDVAFFNTGGDYDTGTGLYTAPNDGFYLFQTTTTVNNISAAMNVLVGSFEVAGTGPSVGTWSIQRCNPYTVLDGADGLVRYNGSITVQLAAGDTVSVSVQVQNGAGDTAGLSVGSVAPGTVPSRTWFTGYNIS